mgnify:CR=1 FL=1
MAPILERRDRRTETVKECVQTSEPLSSPYGVYHKTAWTLEGILDQAFRKIDWEVRPND